MRNLLISFLAVIVFGSCTDSFYQQKYTNFGHGKGTHIEYNDPSANYETSAKSDVDSSRVDTIHTETAIAPIEPAKQPGSDTIIPSEKTVTTKYPAPDEKNLPEENPASSEVSKPVPGVDETFDGLFFVPIILLLLIVILILYWVSTLFGGNSGGNSNINWANVILVAFGAILASFLVAFFSGVRKSSDHNERKDNSEQSEDPEQDEAQEQREAASNRETAQKNISAAGIMAIIFSVVLLIFFMFGLPPLAVFAMSALILIMLLLQRYWIFRSNNLNGKVGKSKIKHGSAADKVNAVALFIAGLFVLLWTLFKFDQF